MTVLIVDQFSGVTPYALQQNPTKFQTLVDEVMAAPEHPWYKPVVLEVEDNFMPQMCTTVIREGAEGMAEVWKHRWDSSG